MIPCCFNNSVIEWIVFLYVYFYPAMLFLLCQCLWITVTLKNEAFAIRWFPHGIVDKNLIVLCSVHHSINFERFLHYWLKCRPKPGQIHHRVLQMTHSFTSHISSVHIDDFNQKCQICIPHSIRPVATDFQALFNLAFLNLLSCVMVSWQSPFQWDHFCWGKQ